MSIKQDTKKLIDRIFKKGKTVNEIEPWVEYLKQKIEYNKEMIDTLENQLVEYKKKQIEDDAEGRKYGVDYKSGIENTQKIIGHLKNEMVGWTEEIESGNFEGYY